MASNGYLMASNCLEIASALAELASMMSDAHYKWPCNLQVAHGINYCTAVCNMLVCMSAPLALLRSARAAPSSTASAYRIDAAIPYVSPLTVRRFTIIST